MHTCKWATFFQKTFHLHLCYHKFAFSLWATWLMNTLLLWWRGSFLFLFFLPLLPLLNLLAWERGTIPNEQVSMAYETQQEYILKVLVGRNYEIMYMPHAIEMKDNLCAKHMREEEPPSKDFSFAFVLLQICMLPWCHMIKKYFTFMCHGYFCLLSFSSFC